MSSTTTERLFEKYNTYCRRVTVADPAQRKRMFRSFDRVIGRFLPEDLDAPILDVACGEGALLAYLRRRGYRNLRGFDLSPENVRICHGLGLLFVSQFDAFRVAEFEPEFQFETIFALDFLEHVPKQRAAVTLESLRARLRPGGALIVQTPNLGYLFASLHRYADLSHEYGVTEKSAVSLFQLAGFRPADIHVFPAFNAATLPGYLREVYLRLLHRMLYLAEDSCRPRIPTKNLLIRAVRS